MTEVTQYTETTSTQTQLTYVESTTQSQTQVVESQGYWFLPSYFSNKFDIAAELSSVEATLLSKLGVPFKQQFVEAGPHQINTIILGQGPPLVLWHGFAAGIAFWQRNLKALSEHHTVYACDLPGFGRSSRLPFDSTDPEENENFFLDALNDWCLSLNLTKFTLLGHSFGAYLAGCFAIRHSERISKLILADPWGIPELPPDFVNNMSFRWSVIFNIAKLIESPFNPVRFVGHYYGPKLIARFRPDLEQKWISETGQEGLISRYIYLLNAMVPASGERAFFRITSHLRYAARPLYSRLANLPAHIPIYQLYGEYSWMDRACGKKLNTLLGPSRSQMCFIRESGHHIYCDNPSEFNAAVLYASVDDNQRMPKPFYF